MREDLARQLMLDFARSTGVTGEAAPRRYLWTDAFAVCNFLGLYRSTGDEQFRDLSLRLVDQVLQVLGRHREDDARQGWISGLSEDEGRAHPTLGGLRIGKPRNERSAAEPPDSRDEWDRDGQYFHYLTKWIRALHRGAEETGEARYHAWAVELAATACRAFTYQAAPGGPKQMVWKMSIDLARPLVPSMGQHDPLDGLITCLELKDERLEQAVADMAALCAGRDFATDDPLGIGGLLDDASRLARLASERGVSRDALLESLLQAADRSLRVFVRSSLLDQPTGLRLAFRELGLAIGLRGLERMRRFTGGGEAIVRGLEALRRYQPLAEQIEVCWSAPPARDGRAWLEHRDINDVMLATSLIPDGYLGFA